MLGFLVSNGDITEILTESCHFVKKQSELERREHSGHSAACVAVTRREGGRGGKTD